MMDATSRSSVGESAVGAAPPPPASPARNRSMRSATTAAPALDASGGATSSYIHRLLHPASAAGLCGTVQVWGRGDGRGGGRAVSQAVHVLHVHHPEGARRVAMHLEAECFLRIESARQSLTHSLAAVFKAPCGRRPRTPQSVTNVSKIVAAGRGQTWRQRRRQCHSGGGAGSRRGTCRRCRPPAAPPTGPPGSGPPCGAGTAG